jgi:hypothetical protein
MHAEKGGMGMETQDANRIGYALAAADKEGGYLRMDKLTPKNWVMWSIHMQALLEELDISMGSDWQ